MTVKCKCGGKYHRTDIKSEYSQEFKRVVYYDTDPLAANWRCNNCGAIRIQRKRQPAIKEQA